MGPRPLAPSPKTITNNLIIAKKGGRGRRILPGILVLPSRFLTLVF